MGAKGSKLSKWVGAGSAQKHIEGPLLLAPKGYVPICVGTNEDTCMRFVVHIKALRDAFFCELLGRTAEEYGFMNEGVLRIPFEVQAFEEWFITNSNRKLKIKIRRVVTN
ncbi:auxin-responsive protein SAUR71-like [Lotus japonicus]|uniref:auxin-responsive protein SAUR71-like n=1 Tax=Lotus japonicus TaxID=34305 RepID=UPI00258A4AE2|nr:auxin-responsive protein SAUR71-like [Lotus japonicus]